MTGNTASDWSPPVSFYFRVDFQNMNGQMFKASFAEVNGIGWNFTLDTAPGNSNGKHPMPLSVSYDRLTLKRPLTPLTEDFAKWVNTCLKLMFLPGGNKAVSEKKACDVIVKLLDQSGQPVAAWSCNHAFPVKCSLGELQADNNRLAMESIELVYNRLERLK